MQNATSPELSPHIPARIEAAAALLQRIERDFMPAVLANSFGAEDMVLMDLIARYAPAIGIFSLDTGRLNPETYDLHQQAQDRYGLKIDTYFPQASAIEAFVREEGMNAFYRSVELRKACCRIRKVEPLRRALGGKRAWIAGLRREQSPTRTDLTEHEYDQGFGLEKFNPLIDWTHDDVWEYIRTFDVPYNVLHDRHYPSIGCAPCTRAVAAGEDLRAGRWWWESPDSKECGLHVKQPGEAAATA